MSRHSRALFVFARMILDDHLSYPGKIDYSQRQAIDQHFPIQRGLSHASQNDLIPPLPRSEAVEGF